MMTLSNRFPTTPRIPHAVLSLARTASVSLLFLILSPNQVQAAKHWSAKLYGSLVLVRSEAVSAALTDDSADLFQSATLEVGNGFDLGTALEYRFTERFLGIEISAGAMAIQSKLTWETNMDPLVDQDPFGTAFPLTLGPKFHFLGDEKPLDFYGSVFLSWTLYSSVESKFILSDQLKLEDDFGVGFDIGADYKLSGGPFVITGFLRYLALQTILEISLGGPENQVPITVDANPLLVNLGAGLSF